ncbi:Uncharacterized protein Rs2_29848 [Raphanus sativus]|nr:Uncharacterized protein Rs2_29848 [Raphanus sativus]
MFEGLEGSGSNNQHRWCVVTFLPALVGVSCVMESGMRNIFAVSSGWESSILEVFHLWRRKLPGSKFGNDDKELIASLRGSSSAPVDKYWRFPPNPTGKHWGEITIIRRNGFRRKAAERANNVKWSNRKPT